MKTIGGRRDKKESLRSAFVQEGMRQLKQVGVNDLSLREIAKQVGVSHMAPYKHFKNKAELLSAIAAGGYHALIEKVDGISSDLETFQQLQGLGAAFVSVAYETPDLCNLMFGGELHQTGSGNELKQAVVDLLRSMRGILETGIDRGEMREFEINRMLQALWAMMTGFVISILARSSTFYLTIDELHASMADMISMWIVGVGT
jgi:AcrR family transcriptional regulator